jgi:hypothetical protein
MDERDTIRCPACGARSAIPVVSGLPTDEAGRAAESGEVFLGGCHVTPGMPDTHCRSCGHEWLVAVLGRSDALGQTE